MQSQEIRQRFLKYFEGKQHAILPSASLVPENDPTVLFTVAGMQPMVPFLLGQPHPEGNRLASVQKCIRTVDIDEVGDNRHNTFFEMLGNWSLNDYFKQEAIAWSWEFLTSSEVGVGLDPARLYITVFAGDEDAPRDEESIKIWQGFFAQVGIAAEVDKPLAEGGRIFTMSKESNWWGPAGQTGPCGPDTEMYYDTGDGRGNLVLEGGMPDFESGRLVEVWNDVFMEYNKNAQGRFEPLGRHNVDTGMGMERICMVSQGVETVFETDLFQPIFVALEKVLVPEVQADTRARRVIADHLRASVMLIADGVRPSNKDRGYILRRLLRRALLHSQLESTGWVEGVVEAIAGVYGEAYPEISTQKTEISQVVIEEMEKFGRTLSQGKREIAKLKHLDGKQAFDLYQSYGFPLELTKEYAVQKGITIDEQAFEEEFSRHQNLSRSASAGQFRSGLADHSEATVRYHTATHLLHQALKDVLGDHVQQRGSNITAERLRFDFTHPEKLTESQVEAVEKLVNEKIEAALPVVSADMSPEEALASGAIGLFGHKYGETVSVYSIGNYSKEICTGPHVHNTRELGKFSINKEEAVSSGVRRIKAVLLAEG